MKIVLAILSFIFINLHAQTINIAVAANVSYAIGELKAEFVKMHPNIKVQVILGSSGKLTAQIKNGAPFGLFMSANMKYPESLYKDKIALSKPVVYAHGALSLFSVHKQDFSDGIKILKSKEIKRIAIANPKTAPYGIASFEALKNAKIYEDIKQKFVYGESISKTVTYAVVAADIGIVATASLYSPKMKKYKEGTNWVAVDSKLYTPTKQGIILIKNSDAYKAFYDFILSKKAKIIFKKYGYIL